MLSIRHTLCQRLFAETLGTGVLTATVVGSAVRAGSLTQDPGVVLVCTAIACGAMLFVLLELLAPISGGHFNPAVTFAMLLQRVVCFREAAAYVGAQLSGSAAGIVLAHLMFEMPPFTLGHHVREGTAIWLSEGVATFGLVFAILISGHYRPRANPMIVAAYVLSVAFFSSTSFANPAITLARTMTHTPSGILPEDVPAFVCVQFIGSLLALVASRWLMVEARKGNFEEKLDEQAKSVLITETRTSSLVDFTAQSAFRRSDPASVETPVKHRS